MLPISTFEFLKDLEENNNRPWFQENKARYAAAHQSAIEFADQLLSELKKIDHIETESGKKSLFRIYRDVRFSKDKSPYKIGFSGSFKRATMLLRGGYYFYLSPGKSLVAGGFWGPNPADLKRIREELAADPTPLRKIVGSKIFKKYFGTLQGDQVKTAPKGYSRDHPSIDLLRYKQFLVYRNFEDNEVLNSGFLKEAVNTYKAMRPFFDYMSEVLTTDSNGVPLY